MTIPKLRPQKYKDYNKIMGRVVTADDYPRQRIILTADDRSQKLMAADDNEDPQDKIPFSVTEHPRGSVFSN